MRSTHTRPRVILAVLLVAVLGLSTAANADDDDLRGVITARGTDGTVTVRADDSSIVIVVLDDDTKITRTDGVSSMTLNSAALLPGLRVEVEGVYLTANRFAAERVSFSRADMKMVFARASAALDTTNTRITSIGDHAVVSAMTVYFRNGSASIREKHKAELEQLAGLARALPAYVIQIEGHASAVGPDALNDTLSMRRADAVAAVLSQNGIPPTNMLLPATVGETAQAATNQTAQGQSENRRAVVTLLRNTGISDTNPANRDGTTVERVDPTRR
jgi:outer membrane protein OmpA-like peptidoglycan-associated protein